jgi:hypothetical protein
MTTPISAAPLGQTERLRALQQVLNTLKKEIRLRASNKMWKIN